MAELQPIPEEQQTGEGGAYISDRFRVDSNAPVGKPANYTFAGICAILAFILFAVTLMLLVQDWQFLSAA